MVSLSESLSKKDYKWEIMLAAVLPFLIAAMSDGASGEFVLARHALNCSVPVCGNCSLGDITAEIQKIATKIEDQEKQLIQTNKKVLENQVKDKHKLKQLDDKVTEIKLLIEKASKVFDKKINMNENKIQKNFDHIANISRKGITLFSNHQKYNSNFFSVDDVTEVFEKDIQDMNKNIENLWATLNKINEVPVGTIIGWIAKTNISEKVR